jgi:hypothetical protein
MMEAADLCETLAILWQATSRHVLEDSNLHSTACKQESNYISGLCRGAVGAFSVLTVLLAVGWQLVVDVSGQRVLSSRDISILYPS